MNGGGTPPSLAAGTAALHITGLIFPHKSEDYLIVTERQSIAVNFPGKMLVFAVNLDTDRLRPIDPAPLPGGILQLDCHRPCARVEMRIILQHREVAWRRGECRFRIIGSVGIPAF